MQRKDTFANPGGSGFWRLRMVAIFKEKKLELRYFQKENTQWPPMKYSKLRNKLWCISCLLQHVIDKNYIIWRDMFQKKCSQEAANCMFLRNRFHILRKKKKILLLPKDHHLLPSGFALDIVQGSKLSTQTCLLEMLQRNWVRCGLKNVPKISNCMSRKQLN